MLARFQGVSGHQVTQLLNYMAISFCESGAGVLDVFHRFESQVYLVAKTKNLNSLALQQDSGLMTRTVILLEDHHRTLSTFHGCSLH